jgi:hypothetical protein
MGVYLAGAAVAVSAYSAYSSGQAQSANAAYQAQVAKNNQTIANQNANYTIQAGQAEATQASLKGRAQSASIKAAQAANGIDVNSGSAEDVQETQRETNTLNTSTVMQNAALRAYGYRTQATNFGAQSGLDTAESDQASAGGDLSALSSLVGGASSVGFKFGGTGTGNGGGTGGGQA